MSSYRISELASRTGIPPSTLRFCEQAGLLPAARTRSNYRVYDEAAVARLEFLGSAKLLGLPLEEIRELLAVWEQGVCGEVRARCPWSWPRPGRRTTACLARRDDAAVPAVAAVGRSRGGGVRGVLRDAADRGTRRVRPDLGARRDPQVFELISFGLAALALGGAAVLWVRRRRRRACRLPDRVADLGLPEPTRRAPQ